jgi:hypothetical protein
MRLWDERGKLRFAENPTKGFLWPDPVKTETKFLRRQGEERPLGPPLAQALTDALLARGSPDGGEPLLVNGSVRRWTRTHLTETMARVGKAAGIKRPSVGAHKLRHTAIVLARVAGTGPLTRSRMLTHSDPRAQARYNHLLPRETYRSRLRLQEALRRYISPEPAALPAPAPPEAPEPS